jgi:hypothetical protein
MKGKKEYKKPQVEEIQLVVQGPVLANCNSVEPTIAASPSTCNTPTGDCAQT